MSGATLLTYIQRTIVNVPWAHWVLMVGITLALTIFLIVKRKSSVYSAIALSLTVFWGLFLLDTAVVSRCLGAIPFEAGHDLSVRNLFHSSENRHVDFYANIIAFIPFGFFLSEFLSVTKKTRMLIRLGLTTLIASVLSLCIECLQLILHVGFSELTDLVMNTVGGFLGAGIAVLWSFLKELVLRKS